MIAAHVVGVRCKYYRARSYFDLAAAFALLQPMKSPRFLSLA